MKPCSSIGTVVLKKTIFIVDRGYESYNNLAHIQEKGWNFLIRIKDGTAGIASGLALPATDEFDVPFHLKLTNKQSNEVKELLKDKNHYRHITNTICHAHQESTTLLYSLNCISESFAFLSQIPRVKPLLRIWMHPLSLYMILRGFMRCAGVLRPLSAT